MIAQEKERGLWRVTAVVRAPLPDGCCALSKLLILSDLSFLTGKRKADEGLAHASWSGLSEIAQVKHWLISGAQ